MDVRLDMSFKSEIFSLFSWGCPNPREKYTQAILICLGIRHSAGAAKLIQLRGPKKYETEFEKALFMAQTFTIVRFSMLSEPI
jgi:hypothetical protein